MKPSVTRAPATLRLVCCAVNDAEYCLEMSALHHVGRPQQFGVHAVSDSDGHPTGAIGWVGVRQHQFPMFDLADCLQLAHSSAPADLATGFIMLVNAPHPFAVRVDQIVGHLEIAPAQITTLPHIVEPQANKRFNGVVRRDEAWVLCADARQLPPKLLPEILSPSLPEAAPNSAAGFPSDTAARSQRGQIMLFSSAQTSATPADAQPMVFGLSLMQVQEIANLPAILPVPGAPNYVFGITNWRNMPLPIIDLETRLGVKTAPVSASAIDPRSRLLIARTPQQNGLLGFPIKPQVKAFPMPIPYQRSAHRLSLDTDLVWGIFDLEDSPLLIPDVAAMLTRNFTPRPRTL